MACNSARSYRSRNCYFFGPKNSSTRSSQSNSLQMQWSTPHPVIAHSRSGSVEELPPRGISVKQSAWTENASSLSSNLNLLRLQLKKTRSNILIRRSNNSGTPEVHRTEGSRASRQSCGLVRASTVSEYQQNIAYRPLRRCSTNSLIRVQLCSNAKQNVPRMLSVGSKSPVKPFAVMNPAGAFTLTPVRRRMASRKLQKLYTYEVLNRKRRCKDMTTQSVGLKDLKNEPTSTLELTRPLSSSVLHEPVWKRLDVFSSVGRSSTGYSGVLSQLPNDIITLICTNLNGNDLGRMCCLNRHWYTLSTTVHQSLWQELVLKKYGFKYENYMLYSNRNDWHLMYAKASTFLHHLKKASPVLTRFKNLLLPPVDSYQGSLAMTADCSTLVWENGEYLQAVDVNTGVCRYTVPVEGERDRVTSRPCLVNTQTKIFLHLNKEIRVYKLDNGEFLGYLEVPKESGKEYDLEPNDFSLDVSIRNRHVTFLTRDALYVFDSESLKFEYQAVHKETTAEEGVVCSEIDFLWAGYHCPGLSRFPSSSSRQSMVRPNSRGVRCNCKQNELNGDIASCCRKSRHIITWLRKASHNIKVFDVCTGKELAHLSGHKNKVLRVRQAQNTCKLEDYFLASLDVAGIVRIWDSTDDLFDCIQTVDVSSPGGVLRSRIGPDGDESEASDVEPIVDSAFRLSFSTSHLMTMSEIRGRNLWVTNDHPAHTPSDRYAVASESIPSSHSLITKGIVLKVWTFDPTRGKDKNRSADQETGHDWPSCRDTHEAQNIEQVTSVKMGCNGEGFLNTPLGASSECTGMRSARETEHNSQQFSPQSRSASPPATFHRMGDEYTGSRYHSTKPSTMEEQKRVEVLGPPKSYVLPDNSYFADFLDNQLVGVWMSTNSRSADFSSTLSDWKVFNCLEQVEAEATRSAAMPVKAYGIGRPDVISIGSLEHSSIFSMTGRGDIWTLLDWKCISINVTGDVAVYDFCRIADTAKECFTVYPQRH